MNTPTDRITIEQYGAVLVLQNNDNAAEDLVNMFRAALLAAQFTPDTVDSLVPDPEPGLQ